MTCLVFDKLRYIIPKICFDAIQWQIHILLSAQETKVSSTLIPEKFPESNQSDSADKKSNRHLSDTQLIKAQRGALSTKRIFFQTNLISTSTNRLSPPWKCSFI